MSHPHHPTLLHKRLPYFGRGLVRNGLVAEYRFDECRNLLKYSQQFDNAAWTKAAGVVVTPNQTTAPDGTMTADTILLPAIDKNSGRSVPVAPNTVYTWSIYRKKGPQGTTVTDFIYDITHSGVIAGTYKNRALSDTWERHTTTFTTPAGCTTVYLYIGYNSTAYPVEYHAWGAQLEAGTAARTYVPTKDKQLLMDYSRPRKNLLLPNQANCCENGTVPFTKATAGDAVTAEPTGTTAAWQGSYSAKVDTANAAASEGLYTTDIIYGLKPSTSYTASAYIKGAAGGETVQLHLRETTDAGVTVDTTLSDVLTLTTAYQRVTVSRTFGTTGRGARLLVLTPTQQNSVFYIDGLQLEEGSSATAWEAPPNIGISGSSTGSDTNDPTWTGTGASFVTDDYIDCGTGIAGANNYAPFTMMVVYAHSGTPSNYETLAGKVYMNPHEWGLRTDAGTTIPVFVIRDDGAPKSAAAPALTVGTYYCISCIFSDRTGRIYTGSTLNAISAPLTGTTFNTSSLVFYVGRQNGANYLFNGDVAYLVVYNRALSQAEITRNYNYLKGYLRANRGIALA